MKESKCSFPSQFFSNRKEERKGEMGGYGEK